MATYNVQSISMKMDTLVKDFQKQKMDVMGIQETQVQDIF